jgi:hypothetical protein
VKARYHVLVWVAALFALFWVWSVEQEEKRRIQLSDQMKEACRAVSGTLHVDRNGLYESCSYGLQPPPTPPPNLRITEPRS